jgi:hypothetical protein
MMAAPLLITLADDAVYPQAPKCGPCAIPMIFMTEISDPKTFACRRLYECPKCRSLAFTAD